VPSTKVERGGGQPVIPTDSLEVSKSLVLVRTGVKQEEHYMEVIALGSQGKSGGTILPWQVVGTSTKQGSHSILVPTLCSEKKRRFPATIRAAGLCSALEQHFNDLCVPLLRRQQQGCCPVASPCIHFAPSLQQQTCDA